MRSSQHKKKRFSMNKHLLLILLGFGLIGCATDINGNHLSIFSMEWSPQFEGKEKNIVESYEDLISPFRAEAMNKLTGEKFFMGQAQNDDDYGFWSLNIKKRVIEICTYPENHLQIRKGMPSGHKCILTRFNDVCKTNYV